MQSIQRDERDNLLSQNSLEAQSDSTLPITQLNTDSEQKVEKQIDDVIDPIEELLKNNNVIPLLAVIDQVDLKRKVQGKPLISILAQRFIPLPQILKGRQIDFTLDDDRRTPLHYAIDADDVKAAAWLIEKGNPNQRDNFGHTPILDAIRLGRQRIFLLCLKNKLYDQRAPIYAAVYNRHWQLRVLHGMGINIFSYRDEQNKSAFQRSLEYCSFDCAQMMIKIRPDLDVDKFQSFSQSKGIIRKLKKIQKSLSIGQRFKQIIRPFLILFVIYLGLNGSFLSQENLYQSSRPFYLILCIMIVGLYGLTYFFGTFLTRKVQYTEKHSLSQILRQPHYTTLEDICPMCVHLTDYRYDHCYICGYCVDKFHFHSFVCVNKANQVFWILGEFIWLYLTWEVLHQFNQFTDWSQIKISCVSSWTLMKFLASLEHFWVQKKILAMVWLLFLVFLYLYQMLYCLALIGMMSMRRKWQEVIHSQKYLHLYRVVKVQDNYMNKQKKIFERGIVGGLRRCIRNLIIYFFSVD